MFRLVALSALMALASGLPKISNVPELDGRIVGGHAVTIEEFPYQVSLERGFGHVCGGSIIDKRHILTAGHCVSGASATSLKIRAGSGTVGKGGIRVQVAQIISHGRYDPYNIDYDVAVLVLAEDLEFNESIQPVRIATSEPAPGTESVISGWGATQEGGYGAQNLQAVRVPVVSNEECNQAYGRGKITDRMICAGISKGGKDACQGDSGGPMVANGELVGVVSWGYGCARPGYPGVYSNVAILSDWIQTTAQL